ncbi:MAG: ATP-binding protein [Bryobacteraceae bacterium]|nr:ATP-binding protein [Bryobacteraceae bacterium]
MPSIEKLSKLFKALASSNLQAAEEVARQIAAEEDRKGHRTAAQLLRGSLVPNGTSNLNGQASQGRIESPSFLMGALSRSFPQVRLSDVALREATRTRLGEVVQEFQAQERLRSLGIRRRSKLILHGPPGCGKSLSASALANELGLPLYVVRFDSVIGAYLGQTATHLRQIFHFAEVTECVLLFDEIDALGKTRGSTTDVGELDRIVIALMQELELSDLKGFIVATSNIPDSLDAALWRRFDLAVEIPSPNQREIATFARAKAKSFKLTLRRDHFNRIVRLKNYAEVESAVEDEARRLALKGL